jgi:hypothetical protein
MPIPFTITPTPAGPGQQIVCRPTTGSFGVRLPDCHAVLRAAGHPDVALDIAAWTTDVTLVLPASLPAVTAGVVAIVHREATGMTESTAPIALQPVAKPPVAFTMSPPTVAPGQLSALDTVIDQGEGFGSGGTVTLTAQGRTVTLTPEGAVGDDLITVRVPADWVEGPAEVRFSRPGVPDSTATLTVLNAAVPVAFLVVPPIAYAGQRVTLDTVVDALYGFTQPGATFHLENGTRSVQLQPESLDDDTAVVQIPADWGLGASVVRFSRANGPDSSAPLALRAPVLSLVLHELRCNKTEDWTKADNIRFELQSALGKALDVHHGFKLDNGEVHRFGDKTYPAVASAIPGLSGMPLVKLRLFDEDWPDGDDHLGDVLITAQPVDRAEGRFNRDGADYRVVYSVTAT